MAVWLIARKMAKENYTVLYSAPSNPMCCLLLFFVLFLRLTVSNASWDQSSAVKTQNKGPEFKKDSFTIIFEDSVSPEHVDRVIDSVKSLHASSLQLNKRGSVSKRFHVAFQV